MKNIVIIATGGTIAGSGDAGKAADYQAGRISVSDILESVPSIRSLAHLKTVQMCNIDSNDMDEERWIALRDLIDAYGADPDVDGIVVTHGTDTLEETAFFLNLTLRHDLPVDRCQRRWPDEPVSGGSARLQRGSARRRRARRVFRHDLFRARHPQEQQL